MRAACAVLLALALPAAVGPAMASPRQLPAPQAPVAGRAVTAAEAFAHAERKCLAEAIYHDAGAEPLEGRSAVAEVIFRRAATPGFPDTICKVVYQGVTRRACEFSFACDGARRRARGAVLWREAWSLAGDLIARRAAVLKADATQGALYFHADYVDPDWEERFGVERTVQIGTHIFYRKKPATP